MSRADGGRVALSGFLYQMLILLGMGVTARSINYAPEIEELSALLHATHENEILHEAMGQDVVVRIFEGQNTRNHLIQCKFSSNQTPITPEDFITIVNSLGSSAQRFEQPGEPALGLYLITNRPLSRGSAAIHAAAKSGELHDQLPTPDIRDVTARVQYTLLEQNALLTNLYAYGARFGLKEEEIKRGLHELIGQLMERTNNREVANINSEDIKTAIVGSRTARPLTLTEIQPEIERDMNEVRDRLIGNDPPFVPRSIMEEINQAVRKG